jgi:hypothetical protein
MNVSRTILIGVSLIAGAGVAGVRPAAAGPLADPAPWVLPVNAFAKAKPGDWTILEGEALLGGKLVREREIIRVGPVKRGVAEVQLFEGAAGSEGWILSFPVDVRRGPDTNLLYDLPWVASDLTHAPTTCTLGSETFDCTEVSYRTRKHQVTVLMAPRVRGSGIVSFAIVRNGKPYWTMKTIGYGTAGKVEWGVGPPRADLEVWDGGAQPTRQREGSEPASGDVYETAAESARAAAPHADLIGCEVTGGARATAVRRLVQTKMQAIEDCYSDALAARPGAGGGPIEVSFGLDDGSPVDIAASGSCAAAKHCATEAIGAMGLSASDTASQVRCKFTFDPGRRARGDKPNKRRLVTRAHPARGGPDLRGVQRIP